MISMTSRVMKSVLSNPDHLILHIAMPGVVVLSGKAYRLR